MKYFSYFSVIVFVFLLSSLPASGEEVANYAGCDVCHGAIHLTAQETKDLMGIEGMMITTKLPVPNPKMVKIDLDGKLKNGSKNTPDDGYEIKIWGSEIFFIQDIRDFSTIQILTSRGQLPSPDNMESYQPRIYLDAGRTHAIDLKDSVEDAWKKMKYTHIYNWVGKAGNKAEWLLLLRKKIFQTMVIMSTAE